MSRRYHESEKALLVRIHALEMRSRRSDLILSKCLLSCEYKECRRIDSSKHVFLCNRCENLFCEDHFSEADEMCDDCTDICNESLQDLSFRTGK
jgi:hypothetical protein